MQEESMQSKEFESRNIYDIIRHRRSARSYDSSRKVDQNDIRTILKAALQAPSPKNRQPWYFYILDDRKKINRLADILHESIQRLYTERIALQRGVLDLDMAIETVAILRNVPCLILVCYEYNNSNYHEESVGWALRMRENEVADVQSIGAAVQNMLLQAEEMGIGSLWMADVLYAYNDIMLAFNLKYPLIAAVAFGYQTEKGRRKNLEEKTEWVL